MTDHIDPTLTKLQVRIYEAIRSCWSIYGQAPSQFEIQRACQCSSTAVQNAVRELRNRGLIIRPKYGIRAVKPTDFDRRVLREPPDPFEELSEGGREKFWRDQ